MAPLDTYPTPLPRLSASLADGWAPAPLRRVARRSTAISSFDEIHWYRLFTQFDWRSGPPGEKAILKLNPERLERIVEATGWCNLEPGTLNLELKTLS
jgi:hypothetical protein